MNRKRVIVLGGMVVLLMLFSFALGMGVSRPEVSVKDPWLNPLRTRLVPEQLLATPDISSAIPQRCLELLTRHHLKMERSTDCVLLIAPASAPVRTLSLGQRSGEVEAIFTPAAPARPKGLFAGILAPAAPAQITVTLEPGSDWPTLQIFKDGGELRIECQSQSCEIGVN